MAGGMLRSILLILADLALCNFWKMCAYLLSQLCNNLFLGKCAVQEFVSTATINIMFSKLEEEERKEKWCSKWERGARAG